MNKEQVRSIIESTLKSGNRTPGLLEMAKMIGVKSKLESCLSVGEVVGKLEENRTLLCKTFGISDASFNDGLDKLKLIV